MPEALLGRLGLVALAREHAKSHAPRQLSL